MNKESQYWHEIYGLLIKVEDMVRARDMPPQYREMLLKFHRFMGYCSTTASILQEHHEDAEKLKGKGGYSTP